MIQKPPITTGKQNIQDKIYTLRDVQVMLDRDLAELYGTKSTRLREQVKRNIKKFPQDFMFELTEPETNLMVSQNAIPSKQHLGGSLPLVFTEQGVSMLATVLKSDIATQISIKIMRAFVNMRKFILSNADMFMRFERIEHRISLHDEKFNKLFQAIENKETKPKQHIFYDGQIFDAYLYVRDIIKSAKKSIKLIDNYIDESILVLFTKRNADVDMKIYTKTISKQLELDIKKYNAQYPKIEVKKFALSHDRFLIIDEKKIYHFGASLKDLGKKWFAVSKMDINSFELLEKLK
ncbi:MAG: ORF6N domain-containing protein [Gammaproteobacteria bacterium]|nr:MAG: ORF6N domain-containing protein [Gammaproteobacteria bacterium]